VYARVRLRECVAGSARTPQRPSLGGAPGQSVGGRWERGESGRGKRRRPETRVLGENSPTGTAGYVGHPARDGPRRRGCAWASRAERERAKAPALAVPGVTPISWALTVARRSGDRISNRRHAVWTARGLRLHQTPSRRSRQPNSRIQRGTDYSKTIIKTLLLS